MSEFDVAGFLRQREAEVLEAALVQVGRAHLAHYEAAGLQVYARRLADLLETVIDCCATRSLIAVQSYADTVAALRRGAGYPLGELQTAINALELSIWNAIVLGAPAESLPFALGLIASALGAIKDRIAVDYVPERPVAAGV